MGASILKCIVMSIAHYRLLKKLYPLDDFANRLPNNEKSIQNATIVFIKVTYLIFINLHISYFTYSAPYRNHSKGGSTIL